MTPPARSSRTAHHRPRFWPWRRIGLFLLAHMAASLFGGTFLALFTVSKVLELMRYLHAFVIMVALFSAIPAAVVIAVVAWRRLDPLKVIPASAAGVGFAGALIQVHLFWYKMFDASVIHAAKFVTAMTLAGLFSGLLLWMIAYRSRGHGHAPGQSRDEATGRQDQPPRQASY